MFNVYCLFTVCSRLDLPLNILVGWPCIEMGFSGNEKKYQNIYF